MVKYRSELCQPNIVLTFRGYLTLLARRSTFSHVVLFCRFEVLFKTFYFLLHLATRSATRRKRSAILTPVFYLQSEKKFDPKNYVVASGWIWSSNFLFHCKNSPRAVTIFLLLHFLARMVGSRGADTENTLHCYISGRLYRVHWKRWWLLLNGHRSGRRSALATDCCDI